MKKIIFTVAVSAISFLSYSQRSCHTTENHERLLKENPNLFQRGKDLENFTQNAISKGVVNQEKTVINIPVVFHIVYNTSSQNVSESQIMSQLDVLNNDFRKLNSDVSNTPSTFSSSVADCELNFCLASVDPSGNSTNGIVRKSTSVTSFSANDAMKYDSKGGSSAWPSGQYLNIWVCNLSGGLLGYAQFPGGPAATDGVVVNFTAFGTTGTAQSPFNKGRTATHEVGHWLNLYHIWGDANCGNDYVSDTPVHYTSNTGCPSHPKSNVCGTSAEMHMNYMDYTDDACMYMFTSGQKNRMHSLFVSGGVRESLKSSNGCSGSTSGGSTTSYCASSASTTSYEWISNVKLNTINHSTGGSGGYADYTSSVSTSLTPGTSYSISLTPAFSGSTYTEYFKVYIDFNNDNDFDDAGELVYSSSGTTTTVSGTFTVPSNATGGKTRMRVVMKDGTISGPCTNFTYGEVEDYSINIESGTTCNSPTNAAVSNVTSSSATLSWNEVSGVSGYTVQIKASTSSSWSTFTTTNTSISFTGMSEGVTYNWQVRSDCSSTSSNYTIGSDFTTTTSCTDIYESNNTRGASKTIPVNTDITAMIGTSTDIDWFKFSNTSTNKNIRVTLTNLPFDYDLYLYNSSGTLLARSENGGTNSEIIKYNNGAVATYYIRVKGYNGAFSNSQCYTLNATIGSTAFKFDENDQYYPKEEIEFSDVNIYPNPSSNGQFTYELSNDYTGSVKLIIFDATGRVVENRTIDKSEKFMRTELDVSEKNKGLYFVRVVGDDFETISKLLFIE
jgi:hypothetical protein